MIHDVLIVDDDQDNLTLTKMQLESPSIRIETATSGAEAVSLLADQSERFTLVLIDMHMPDLNGPETARLILASNNKIPLAAFSFDLTRQAVIDAMNAGMKTFIEKSLPPDQIVARVHTLLKEIELSQSLSDDGEGDSSLILMNSEKMKKSMKMLKPMIMSEERLFISGETGTGKSMLARVIHDAGPRSRRGKFVSVNCAGIPKDLVESILFGHKKGSFTGAIGDSPGFFREAHRGTLFLDEIAELPLEIQPKLLSAIQDGEITPVGCSVPIKIDVRIISATHRDLSKLVVERRFREDLYFRLVVLTLNMPPLRERLEDIPMLIGRFTEKYNQRNRQSGYFEKETLSFLEKYSWPGNIRELETIVIRHLFNANGGPVGAADLDPSLFKKPVCRIGTHKELKEKQEKEEQMFLQKHLDFAPNKAQAARNMKISSSYLNFLSKRCLVDGQAVAEFS